MKAFGKLLVALLFLIVMSGTAFAQAQPEKATAPAKKAAKTEPVVTHKVIGELTAVDPANKSIKVKTGTKEMTFSVSDKALPELQQVKTGDKIVVKYTGEANTFTATFIGKAKPKASPETKPKQ